MPFSSRIKYSDKEIHFILMMAITAFMLISFISNSLMMAHEGFEITAHKLFEISFYYFTPLFTWCLIIPLLIKYIKRQSHNTSPSKILLNLVILGIILSPLLRTIDIILDFSIKYLIGFIDINPLRILKEVWLVIVASVYQTIIIFIVISFLLVWIITTENPELKVLNIKEGSSLHKIPMEDIQFLKSLGNYVEIVCSLKKYKMRGSLKNIKLKLNGDFKQIHRSVIVNQKNVSQWQHWRNGEYIIKMKNNHIVTSSRSFKLNIETLALV